MVALWVALLTLSDPSGAPPDVVVTAAPPVDAERLADALRTYLVEYGIRVGTATPTASGDLRRQLGEARRTGEAVRAVAVVRVEAGAPGSIEIELVDLATQKALVTTVPRLPRDEDLYRALALKIQALLRSTLSEANDRLAQGLPVARLVEPSGVDSPGWTGRAPSPISLETGYTAVAFPLGNLFLQGVSFTGLYAVAPWLDLCLGAAALDSARARDGDVVTDATVVPLVAAARFRRARERYELLIGPDLELGIASVRTSSASAAGRQSRDPIVAAGGEIEGRVRVGSTVWFYLRPSALGVLVGPYYLVQGRTAFDTSRFQVAVAAGIGIGMR